MLKPFLLACVLPALALAADWPQFQGLDRNGVSPEKGLADSWPESGPKLLWSNDKMGQGYGGAVVQGGKVYVMDRVDGKQDVLRCLSLETGRQEWQYAHDAPGNFKGGYNGSRNLPSVDDKHVFAFGVFGTLHAVSKETHQALWTLDLVKEYESTVSNWGFCQSPVLYKDWVIAMPLTKKAGVLALDKATGKVAWQSEPVGTMAWTSPLVVTLAGVDQVVVLSTRDRPILSGLDAATGKILWQYKDWKCPNPIASPIAIPGDRIFITGGYRAGCALVKVTKDGDAWAAAEVFKSEDLSSQAQNPVFYNGHIYANSSANKSGLMCMDLTGQVKWKTSNEKDDDVGNLLIADDKVIALGAHDGTLRLLKATPDAFTVLSTFKAADGQEYWGPMALSDGKLLVRLRRSLKCYDLRPAAP